MKTTAQKRAALIAAVEKGQAAGLSYDTAYRKACEKHPDLVAPPPPGFANDAGPVSAERARQIRLVRAVELEIHSRGLDRERDWNRIYREVTEVLNPELAPPVAPPDTAPAARQFTSGMRGATPGNPVQGSA